MKTLTTLQLIEQKYEEWQQQQLNSNSGYDYEKSFVKMWQSLGREVLERSANTSEEGKDRKKNFKQ